MKHLLWRTPSTRLTSHLISASALLAATLAPANFCLADAPVTVALPTVALSKPQPFIARGGLPNVARKLQNGEAVSVVFLGGSVTQGGGEDGYVAGVTRWLQTQYPKAKITGTNAGIGGTNSEYGKTRFDRDVLAFKPDLLVVEYAVNDPGDMSRHMETIVRKTWMHNAQTDIVFMYHLDRKMLPTYAAGSWQENVMYHERVAEFYNIPIIGTGAFVAAKVNADAAKWEDLYVDNVHPKPAGYALYIEAITNALQPLLTAGTSGPHLLAETFSPNLMVYSQRLVAVPLPEPAPFTSKAGDKAQASYALPIVGTQWIDNPEYSLSGQVLWRLSFQSRDEGGKLDASMGLDKTKWKGLMTYFIGGNQFTDTEPKAPMMVEGTSGGKGTTLGYRHRSLPILSFIAPRAGRYVFAVKSAAPWFYSYKNIAFNAVHFSQGQTTGQSVAFFKTTSEEKARLDLEFEVKMQAGDELAFQPDTEGRGNGLAYWQDLNITAGYFGE